MTNNQRVWDQSQALEYAANLSRDVARKVKARSEEHEAVPLLRLVAIDEVIRFFEAERRAAVEQARTAGASWAEVGESLGISKQGAAKRYGGKG